MKPAARKGDICTGHGGATPRPAITGSPDVFFNGKPAHRKGDLWAIHSGHPGILIKGSNTVLTNGRQQGRRGDPVNCKSFVAQGSPNIFIGDSSQLASAAAAAAGGSSGPVDLNDPNRFAGGAGAGGGADGSGGGYSGSGTIEGEGGVMGGDDEVAGEVDNSPIDASDDDIDWLTTCMMDEALNQKSSDAWAAVAQVVVNRKIYRRAIGHENPAWRGTLKGIILATDQFSGFYFTMKKKYTRVISQGDYAGAERRGRQKMAKFKGMSKWATMRAVAEQVVNATYNGGNSWRLIKAKQVNMYCNLRVSKPKWGTAQNYVTKIEDHTFFKI